MKKFYSVIVLLVISMFVAVPLYAATDYSMSNFIRFTGPANGDNLGRSAVLCDLNADTYDDLIMGAHDSTGRGVGNVYVLYGSSTNPSSVTLSSANAIVLSGATTEDLTGISLACGDLDNDTYDDIVVGSSRDDSAGTDRGKVTIVYGSSTQLTSTALSTHPSFTGEANDDRAGTGVAVGDVNGDTYTDVIITAQRNDDGASNAGAAYIVYSSSSKFSGSSSLSTAVEFTGELASSGAQNVGVGNFNGDAYDDVVVGATSYSSSTGAVYVIYGQSSQLTSASLSTVVRFVGAATGNGFGETFASGDLNNDGYDELLASAPSADSVEENDGIVYLLYGQSSAWTSGTISSVTGVVQFSGENGGDNAGNGVDIGDLNGDAYLDVVIGGNLSSETFSTGGSAYFVPGQSTTFTSGSLGSLATLQFTPEAETDTAGRWIATGDMNSDGVDELLIGAPGASDGGGYQYLGYMGIDLDEDGVLGTAGLFDGTDCNDSDSAISANQTYYADSDGDGFGNAASTTSVCSFSAPEGYVTNDDDVNDLDADNDSVVTAEDCNDADADVTVDITYYADADSDGLGDPDVTTSVCSLTAPDGYVDNANDTTDAIPNADVEIAGDEVDNDTDGEVDEVNFGTHPYYSTLDAQDVEVVAAAVTGVAGATGGDIEVTYADNSVFRFAVFDSTTSKENQAKQFTDKGYAVVLGVTGKKLALVDLFSGVVEEREELSSKKSYNNVSLKLLDVRGDDSIEAVVTLKKKKKVKLCVVKVKVSETKLTLKDSVKVEHKKVEPAKTKVYKKQLQLRNENGKVLFTVKVKSSYRFGSVL